MANTYIVSNSQFKPYTFEEKLKPYAMYKEAYEQNETKLDSMSEAALSMGLHLKEQDVTQKQMYDEFMNKLQEASDSLSSGLSSQTVKDITGLWKSFKSTFVPMKAKIEKRAILAEEQRKLKQANPNLVFDKDYATMSLDNVDMTSSYDYIDYNQVEKDVIAEMHNLLNSKTPSYTTINYPGIGNMIVGNVGWTQEKAIEELNNPDSELGKVVQKVGSKYWKQGFNKDNLNNYIKNVVSHNASATNSQFVKGSSSTGGGRWMTVGNKAYYLNDSGTPQFEADIINGNPVNVKPYQKSDRNNGNQIDSSIASAIKNIDQSLYVVENNGTVKEYSKDNYLKSEEGYVTSGTQVSDFNSLPESIKNLVKNYPEGYVSVMMWPHTENSMGRYQLVPNYNGTGLRWSSASIPQNNNPNNNNTPRIEGIQVGGQ